VRCTSCKHTWHAEIPIDLRYSEPKTKKDKDEPEEDLQSVKAEKLPGKYRAMLQDKKRLQAMAVEIGMWGGMAALAVLILALGYFLRVDVVKAFPRVAGAYAMVGLKVNPTNLEIVNTTAQNSLKGGRFVATIKVEVRNVSGEMAPVPPVRVKLLDSSLQPFNTVLIPSNGLAVDPNATRTLTFDVPDPRNLTSTIDVQFDYAAMKKGDKAVHKSTEAAHDVAAGPEEEIRTAEAEPVTAPAPAPAVDMATPPAPAPATAEAIPAPQDSDVSTQTIDTGAPAESLSRKPAHPLRGALSFGDDTAKAAKTSHGESKS
jgi:hypothetical protein